MPEISEQDYKEYTYLKKQAERIAIFSSLKESDRLEDDIDLPVKKCVALLALLGCEPRWSCCGFDYVGQPLHKDHEYGYVHITVANNARANIIAKCVNESFKGMWVSAWNHNDGWNGIDLISSLRNGRAGFWDNTQSIHYGELGATMTFYLYDFLLQFQDNMLEDVIVNDTNVIYKNTFEFWQYPPKKPWTIRKHDYVKQVQA